MTNLELFRLLGDIREEHLQEAEQLQMAPGLRAQKRSAKRAVLVAALILLTFLLVGCAVVYAIHAADLRIGNRKTTRSVFDPYHREIIGTEPVSQQVLTYAGIQGSPGYQAAKEWFEFLQTYDQDRSIRKEAFQGDPEILFPDTYLSYHTYSQEMVDKLNELADKYGLQLLSTPMEFSSTGKLTRVLSIDHVLLPGSTVDAFLDGGACYPQGNFWLSINLNMPKGPDMWQYTVYGILEYCRKDCLSPEVAYLDQGKALTEWNYKTASGATVLIVKEQEGDAYFFCDCGDATYVFEFRAGFDPMTDDPDFKRELSALFNDYAGRPSRLYYAANLTRALGGAKVYLKREDLNHTGAHKINNVLGQALLAKRMGKTRVIAETGAGQHGVATATAAALMGMECEIFMGREDTERQALNVYKMRLLGAKVHAVESGTATLKDAVSETMREWTRRIDDTHYILGSVMGPHPFPTIVRDFQAVISREIRSQILAAEGKLPDAVLACVGGGSNAIGAFYHFIPDEGVRLIGCEAAGRGIGTFETAATIATGRLGIFHGMKSYFCQDQFGQIAPVYSISAGLDYPGVGPEHAYLHDTRRAEYVPVTDDEAVDAFEYLSRMEGIIPAIESAHAVAYAMKLAPQMGKEQILVVNLSGRGDKDCAAIARYRGEEIKE